MKIKVVIGEGQIWGTWMSNKMIFLLCRVIHLKKILGSKKEVRIRDYIYLSKQFF